MAKHNSLESIRHLFPQIREWAVMGLTGAEIARRLDVNYSTFQSWRARWPEFNDLISGAKKYMAAMLLNSIYKTALGYPFEETWSEYDGKGKKIKTGKVTKWQKPDTTAAIFLLCNLDKSFRRTDDQGIVEKMEGVTINDDIA